MNVTLSGSVWAALRYEPTAATWARIPPLSAQAVETAAALGGLEGGREPLLRAAGGLHVVMPVEEHGGRVRPVPPVPVHVGMHAGDLQHLDVLP